MHDPANGLLRIPLLGTSVNEDVRVAHPTGERRCAKRKGRHCGTRHAFYRLFTLRLRPRFEDMPGSHEL
jgi:hypothetical protein